MTAFRTSKFQPSLEVLEDRCLMTTAALKSGILNIVGTDNAETITVRQINNRISVDGVKETFAASQVTRIVVDAKAGNDKVFLNSESVKGQQALRPCALVYGGLGNDMIVGTQKADKLYGGAGNDSLYGNAGNDQIWGGAGNDLIEGQAGNDTTYGEAGTDKMYGGDGLDHLFGTAGDLVDGGNDGFFDDYTVYFYPQSPALNGATWDDIKQGMDGNCVILSTLSSVSTHTNLADRIEYYSYENGQYWYKIHLYGVSATNGVYPTFQWVSYNGNSTDDEPRPTENGEFWTILFDRAVKQQAIYNGADYHYPAYTMSVITGRSTDDHGNRGTWNMDDVLYIQSCFQNGYDVVVCTNSWDSINADMSTPLVKWHCYTVYDIDTNGNVLLRNPWHVDTTTAGKAYTGDFYDGMIVVGWAEFSTYLSGYCIS